MEDGVVVAAAEKPKPYVLGPLAGGDLPDVGSLLTETFAEFGDNIGPYAMAGVGLMLVTMPLAFVMIFGIYIVVFGGMFGTMIAGAAFSVFVSQTVSEDLGAVAMVVTQLATIAVPVVLVVGAVAAIGAILAPLNASLARAVAAQQRGGPKLELTSPFSTFTQDLVSVVVAALLIAALVTMGAFLCYLPALAVPLLFGFGTTMVALHRTGAGQGLRTSMQHALGHLSWHLPFGLLYLVFSMVAGYVPVLGPMFLVAFHVRAYRHVFGDGEEPNLQVGAGRAG